MHRLDADKAELLRTLIDNVVGMAMVIPLDDARQLVHEVEHHESFGVFVDPTWWMKNVDNMRTRKEIFQAFASFRSALEKTKAGIRQS